MYHGTNERLYLCHFNEVFSFYGDNVYKVGKAMDVGKRASSYTTYYVKPIEIKFVSEVCKDYTRAETCIFDKLELHRLVNNGEFFKCDLVSLIQIIERIVEEVSNGIITSVVKETIHIPRVILRLTEAERKQQKIEIANQLIEDLGINNVEKMNQQQFHDKLSCAFNEGALKDSQYIRLLFGIRENNANAGEKSSIKPKMGYCNTILSNVGYAD